MKHVATTALMVTLGVAGVFAEERPVRMRFSGSFIPTSIVMQPNTITDEELLAGNGGLGSFTFRKLRTDLLTPQPSAACSGPSQVNIPVVAGGGVFRFEDGSLLTVVISEEGALCIDFDAAVANLTERYQVTGGTGRFEGASGTLALRATVRPVLFTASGQAVLLTSTGELEGTVAAARMRDEQ